MFGLVGLKVGMSRYFDENGNSIPVTIIRVSTNRIVQVKNTENDGYNSIQLTFGEAKTRFTKSEAIKNNLINELGKLHKRGKYINLPKQGHFKKHQCKPGVLIKEFRVSEEEMLHLKEKKEFNLDYFNNVKIVDITGKSKGKGFSGVIKRWNFHSQPASHGNSLSHRVPGSIGQNQTPGRVFKGKKMAGHLGCDRVTMQGLEIVHIDLENSILVIKGAVPGNSGGIIYIKPSIKSKLNKIMV